MSFFINNENNQILIKDSKIISDVSMRQVKEKTQSQRRAKMFSQILSNRKMPLIGWKEEMIESFLSEIAQLDSNNFDDNCGLGEREGRCFSNLVRRRNFSLTHGIGRSGDVSAEQPKAIGSSILAKVTNILITDALKISGLKSIDTKSTLLLPLCTGMSLSQVFQALRIHLREEKEKENVDKTRIVWTRLDQKTCIKSIQASGYDVFVVEPILEGDELVSNLYSLEKELQGNDCKNIAAIVSSTSCFAPRASDDVEAIAKLCQKYNVAHIINNAYGVQSRQRSDQCIQNIP